jgi:hypothetical protein
VSGERSSNACSRCSLAVRATPRRGAATAAKEDGGQTKSHLCLDEREEPHGLRWAQHGLKAGCGGRQVAPVLGLVDQREGQLAEEGDETEYRASRGDGTQ